MVVDASPSVKVGIGSRVNDSPIRSCCLLRVRSALLIAKKCKGIRSCTIRDISQPEGRFIPVFGGSLKCFYQCWKSDNMAAVSTQLKCFVSLAVVCGILYVLISPLPEVDATFSGKTALSFFILVTHALLGLFFVLFLVRLRPIDPAAFAHADVIDLICVRLC